MGSVMPSDRTGGSKGNGASVEADADDGHSVDRSTTEVSVVQPGTYDDSDSVDTSPVVQVLVINIVDAECS